MNQLNLSQIMDLCEFIRIKKLKIQSSLLGWRKEFFLLLFVSDRLPLNYSPSKMSVMTSMIFLSEPGPFGYA